MAYNFFSNHPQLKGTVKEKALFYLIQTHQLQFLKQPLMTADFRIKILQNTDMLYDPNIMIKTSVLTYNSRHRPAGFYELHGEKQVKVLSIFQADYISYVHNMGQVCCKFIVKVSGMNILHYQLHTYVN